MRNIKLNKLVEKSLYTFLLFVSHMLLANGSGIPLNPPSGGGDIGATGPGGRNTPIDMYEGVLLMVAIVMMVGYYLYTRNRKTIA